MSSQHKLTNKQPDRGQKRELGKLLILSGLLFGSLSIAILLKQPKPSLPRQATGPTPEILKPSQDAIEQYAVAPDLPKFLSIPAIQVDKVRVFRLGLEKNYTIAAPTNIFDAGWYEGSSKPGQAGAQFVYGHVSNLDAHGVFYDLYKLKPGDTIRITRGDDVVFTYSVVSTQRYPASDVPMDKVLSPIKAGRQGLNLMTCAGHVEATGGFSERLVVYASLTKS